MIDARLSDDIEVGARRRPMFSTDISSMDSGHEVRNRNWRYAKYSYQVTLAPDDEDAIDFFHAAAGAADSFRFHDHKDFEGIDELIGTGTGGALEMQLVRNFTKGGTIGSRKVTLPINGTVVIKYNGVVQVGGYSVDYSTGVVTATPGLGVLVTADFEFDIPVRFEEDALDIIALAQELEQTANVELIEVWGGEIE